MMKSDQVVAGYFSRAFKKQGQIVETTFWLIALKGLTPIPFKLVTPDNVASFLDKN